jgi:hypothetical protein
MVPIKVFFVGYLGSGFVVNLPSIPASLVGLASLVNQTKKCAFIDKPSEVVISARL